MDTRAGIESAKNRQGRDSLREFRLWDAFLLHRASMCDVDAMEAAERSVELFDSRVALATQDGNRAAHEPLPLEG